MVGITSYAGYIPRYRMERKTIFSAMGWLGQAAPLPGEKAVANYDEDSLTMAVASAMNCLEGFDRGKVDALYFATTTAPYKERQNAGVIATVLDLRSDIQTADFTGSAKAGTTALLSACDAIKAGSAKNVMVCASDCRLARMGSSQEMVCGDGAAAFLLSDSGVIADLRDSYSVSYDFADHQRTDEDRFDRAWEDRWIRDVGYSKFISEAISGLLKKGNLSPKDVAKVCYPCLYIADHANIGKKLGFEPGQIQDHMVTTVGYTGTASPLVVLVAALEDAKPGDKILTASYGNGSVAVVFELTEGIDKVKSKTGIKEYLSSKKALSNYEKYLNFRDMLPIEASARAEIGPTAVSAVWRERKWILSFVGSKCKRCGTPQYPPQRICVKPDCGAIDEMEDYGFSDKKGSLFTYTGDNLTLSPDPPQIYGMVDFEGGGRTLIELTDCNLDELRVDMPVRMSLRRKYYDRNRGIYSYWWKAVPS